MGKIRHCFTILELFLSVSLVALVGTIVLMRAKPMLDHYRFNHSLGQLERELTLSKRLAQTAITDIEFHIEQKGKDLLCIRKTDEPLTIGGTLKVPITIPHLKMEKEEKAIILFTATGWILKDFIIEFSLGKNRKTIDLSKSLY